MRRRVCVVARLRTDARLFDPAPPRRPGTIGRPRVVGQRQPTLARRLADPRTSWQAIAVAGWYGGKDRRIEIAAGTAVWHHPGLPVVPLRWVLVRGPERGFRSQAFLCTDLDAAPADILAWFVRRWATETTFQPAPGPARRAGVFLFAGVFFSSVVVFAIGSPRSFAAVAPDHPRPLPERRQAGRSGIPGRTLCSPDGSWCGRGAPRALGLTGAEALANQFKRGDSVRFKTVGAGVASSRRGVVVRTVDSGRGVRVEVKDKEGRVFRPHLSTVKLAR